MTVVANSDSPGMSHWKAVTKILQYLRTEDLGITYGSQSYGDNRNLSENTGFDHATGEDTRCFVLGADVTLGRGYIS